MTNKIRLQGVEGGISEEKDGVSHLKIGIMTGNLWATAVQEYQRYGRVEGMAVQAFSFDMTTNLAEFMLNRPYTLIEEGLHVDIDLGDFCEKDISEIMIYNKTIHELERKVLYPVPENTQEIRLMISERRAEEYREIVRKLVTIKGARTGLPHERCERYELLAEEAELTLQV